MGKQTGMWTNPLLHELVDRAVVRKTRRPRPYPGCRYLPGQQCARQFFRLARGKRLFRHRLRDDTEQFSRHNTIAFLVEKSAGRGSGRYSGRQRKQHRRPCKRLMKIPQRLGMRKLSPVPAIDIEWHGQGVLNIGLDIGRRNRQGTGCIVFGAAADLYYRIL